MKHTIILRSARGTAGGWFNLSSIRYKGIDYCITKKLEVVKRDLLKPSDEAFMKRITPDESFTFNYDDSIDENSNNHRKLMGEIIPYHHQVMMEDFRNPNAGAAMLFEFEDIAMNDIRNFKVLNLIRSAMNKVWAMSYREKVDCMYYFGEKPLVMSDDGKLMAMNHKQVAIRLAESGFGVVMKRTPFGQTGKSYIEHFVEDYKASDPVYILKTTILKALSLPGNDNRPLIRKEGATLIFGDKLFGTVEEGIVWFMNNPEQKNFLINTVSQNDRLDVDDLDMAMIEADNGNLSAAENLEEKRTEDEFRQYAKRLMVQGWHNGLMENLKPKVAEAEKIWKEVATLGLQPQIDAMDKANLDKVTRLVESKKKELTTA